MNITDTELKLRGIQVLTSALGEVQTDGNIDFAKARTIKTD